MIDTVRLEWARFRALRRSRQADSTGVAEGGPGLESGARVVSIASGKGGTGKSIVATNLACLRARKGERVLLVDFDAGLANDHLLLGLAPQHDLGHVMEGEVAAEAALVEGPHGLKLLSGGVGRHALQNPTRKQLDRLFRALRPLESSFDLLVVDHGAGIGYSTVAQLAATSTLLLVSNPEVTALSDAYALYKRATMVNPRLRTGFVANRCDDGEAAHAAWDRFRAASQRFLGHAPEFVDWIPADAAVGRSVQERRPVALGYPHSESTRALERIARWPALEVARTPKPYFDRARRALR